MALNAFCQLRLSKQLAPVILFTFLIVSSLTGFASTKSICSTLLFPKINSLQPIDIQSLDSQIDITSAAFVENLKLIGHYQASGDTLRAIESLDGIWVSKFKADFADILGSPLYFLSIVGPKVAYEFGFRQVTDRLITVPDATFLNKKIDQLNIRFKSRGLQPLSHRFYETDTGNPVTGAEYVRNFIDGKIPLERQGPLAVHDVSAHIATIFLPNWYIQRLQKLLSAALEFNDFLSKKNDPKADEIADVIIKTMASRIDQIGNFTIHFARERQGLENESRRSRIWGVPGLIARSSAQLSPYNFIKSVYFGAYFIALLEEFSQTERGQQVLALPNEQDIFDMEPIIRNDFNQSIENLRVILAIE